MPRLAAGLSQARRSPSRSATTVAATAPNVTVASTPVPTAPAPGARHPRCRARARLLRRAGRAACPGRRSHADGVSARSCPAMSPARCFVLPPIAALLLSIGGAMAQSPSQADRVAMRFEVFGPAGLHVVTNRMDIDEVGERY